MPSATLDEIRAELSAVADDAPESVASELRALETGLTNLPEAEEDRQTQFRETEDRLSEVEQQTSGELAENIHTIQQNLQLVAEDEGY